MQDIIDVRKPENSTEEVKVSKKQFLKRNLARIVVGVVLLISIASAVFYYVKYQDVKTDPASAQQQKNQAETDRVLTSLSAVILIDEKDKPTVARVDDPEKLKKSNETFYKNVQKGDYLVIFPKRAIIFRESTGQIVNVAPIINTDDLKEKQEEQSQQPPADTKAP